MPDSPTTTGAVFLSYAREDSEAARRLADALRAFGMEVWFDQSELRGGDSWDAKIRTQIRTCALFVAVVSAHSQSRGEGYFRREWKIAVERTHDMASGVPFLLPVVIDETAESEALVPDEFMRVQWTRLPHGMPTPQFVEQVKRLLEGRGAVAAVARVSQPVGSETTGRETRATKTSGQVGRRVPAAAWVLVPAVIVIALGILWWRKSGAEANAGAGERPPTTEKSAAPVAPTVSNKSIAVLPFASMSEDKENAFFTDGIHEDILTNLALVRQLHVVSRTSVMQYRSTTKSIRQIGEELGVAYVLEGSVRRAGNKVRVTGQLINARTDEHVWAKAYDRDITDIFAIQAELSQEIAGALAAALSPEEKSLIERRPTSNLAAYDAYLKAHQLAQGGLNQRTEVQAIETLLTRAVELDPQFAVAWAELGRHRAFVYFSEVDHSAEQLARARAAIETAVRLAPDAPEVIEGYGDFFYYGFRDYGRAVEQYQRLAVLRPNDAAVFGSLGLIHRRQGRWAESLAELRRAVQLEPRNLRYLRALQQLVQALDLYDEALAVQRKVVEQNPGDLAEEGSLHGIAFFARGSAQETTDFLANLKPAAAQAPLMNFVRKTLAIQVGNFAEAVRLDAEQRYYDGAGFPHWAQDLIMAFVRTALGDQAAARALAEQAIPAAKADLEQKPSANAWSGLAGAYVLVGNREEALRCSRRAMELVPESNDAVAGPGFSLNHAATLAWLGDKDAALAELARLLRTPYGENIYTAKFSPNWLPLRGDPRFEALVNDPKNNAPML
jgi:TolB-like protein/Tfp pilus assembly protein PilF